MQKTVTEVFFCGSFLYSQHCFIERKGFSVSLTLEQLRQRQLYDQPRLLLELPSFFSTDASDSYLPLQYTPFLINIL